MCPPEGRENNVGGIIGVQNGAEVWERMEVEECG